MEITLSKKQDIEISVREAKTVNSDTLTLLRVTKVIADKIIFANIIAENTNAVIKLWEGADYDAKKSFTDEEVEARLKELLDKQ